MQQLTGSFDRNVLEATARTCGDPRVVGIRFALSCRDASRMCLDAALWNRIALTLHPDLHEEAHSATKSPSPEAARASRDSCFKAFAAAACRHVKWTNLRCNSAPRQLHALFALESPQGEQLCMYGGWHESLGPCAELQLAPTAQLPRLTFRNHAAPTSPERWPPPRHPNSTKP